MTDQEFKAAVLRRLDGIDGRLDGIADDVHVIKTLLGIADLDPEQVRTAVMGMTPPETEIETNTPQRRLRRY